MTTTENNNQTTGYNFIFRDSSERVIIAQGQAMALHHHVKYGAGNMFEQVNGVARLIKDYSVAETKNEKEDIIIAALLHKSMETNRLAEGVDPLTVEEIEQTYGQNVASIIKEISSEPTTPKGTPKDVENKLIAEWAQTLSPAAREILLAEKVMNFKTSAEKPNMKKPPEWHLAYIETRMQVVEVLRPVNERMYQLCLHYGKQVKERFTPQKCCTHDDNGIKKAQEQINQPCHTNGN